MWSKVLTAIVCLLYVASPIDIIPDFLVGIGQLDDIAAIGLTLRSMFAKT